MVTNILKPELPTMGFMCIWFISTILSNHSKSFIKYCFFSLSLVILCYYSFLTKRIGDVFLKCPTDRSQTWNWILTFIFLTKDYASMGTGQYNIVQHFFVSMSSASISRSIFLDVSVLTTRILKKKAFS